MTRLENKFIKKKYQISDKKPIISIFLNSVLFFIKGKKILYTCFLVTGCVEKNDGLKVLSDVYFGRNSNCNIVNSYFEHQLSQELIYMYDHDAQKEIKFYTLNGSLVKSVSLRKSKKIVDNIASISVISIDTIIINSDYTNQILVINRKGEIWKKIDLTNKLIDKKQNQYEFVSSPFPANQNGSSLLLNCCWRLNLKDVAQELPPRDNLEELSYFYKNYYESPFFITLSNIFSDSPKIDYHAPGLCKKILNNIEILAEPPSFTCIENNIFIYSLHSDKLFIINRSDFSFSKSIQIKSEFTSIGASTIKINAENIDKVRDSTVYKIENTGRIIRVLFNVRKKEYYCFVKHKKTNKELNDKRNSFSIIVYKPDFQKKKEYVLDNRLYDYNSSIVTGYGLMILKNDTTKNLLKNDKKTYSRLVFD